MKVIKYRETTFPELQIGGGQKPILESGLHFYQQHATESYSSYGLQKPSVPYQQPDCTASSSSLYFTESALFLSHWDTLHVSALNLI